MEVKEYGIYNTIEEAQKAMGAGFDKEYMPIRANAEKYKALYNKYNKLADFIENSL